MTKIYLEPLILRCGAPVIHYVIRDSAGFLFGTLHMLKDRDTANRQGACRGDWRDYHARNEKTVSKEFFDGFVAEAKKNHRKYKGLRRVGKGSARLSDAAITT